MALHTFHLDNDDKASKKKQDIPTINNAFIFILGNKTTSSYSYDVEWNFGRGNWMKGLEVVKKMRNTTRIFSLKH
jgi:hypothetical protein